MLAREELKAWAEASDDEADGDEPGLDMRGDDEDIWDEDNAYLEMLTREGERLRSVNGGLPKAGGAAADDEEELSDSDSDDDLDEELTYLSPIDNVNPYITFKRALTGTCISPYRFFNGFLMLGFVDSVPNEEWGELSGWNHVVECGAADFADGDYEEGGGG